LSLEAARVAVIIMPAYAVGAEQVVYLLVMQVLLLVLLIL
jgi:hypothetical protein